MFIVKSMIHRGAGFVKREFTFIVNFFMFCCVWHFFGVFAYNAGKEAERLMNEAAERVVPHRLTLEDRQHLRLTGVTEVEHFEEDAAALRTGQGRLTVRGEGLKLRNLNPEGGVLCIDGTVSAIVYEGAPAGGGFLRRLLG